MFGTKKDTIQCLEEKAARNLEFIGDFINQLETTKAHSKLISDEAKENITRLNVVVAYCERVEKFSDKLLGKLK